MTGLGTGVSARIVLSKKYIHVLIRMGLMLCELGRENLLVPGSYTCKVVELGD